MQAKSLPKWGPLKGPPRLASATTIVGQGIWSIMKGVLGLGRGSRKSLNFGRENLDSMGGPQDAWFEEPTCATNETNCIHPNLQFSWEGSR